MTDTVVLVLTGFLAVVVLTWEVWGIWYITRRTPTRQRALANVVGIITGTTLLGLVLPALLMGMIDPFPVWLVYGVLAVTSASVLAWRWDALVPSNRIHASTLAAAALLVLVLTTAAFAVT